MRTKTKPDVQSVWRKYERSNAYKQQIGLYDTVKDNENFFIGKQWEGVQSNGLPTPVFNFLKRVTMFQVATVTSDNVAARVNAILPMGEMSTSTLERIVEMINRQIEAVFERNSIVSLLRVFARNAAVDGDACLYSYFDPSVKNGQNVPGEIKTEVVENTRVHFGNPWSRDVQSQPYIIISRRLPAEDVQWLADSYRESGNNSLTDEEIDCIKPDDELTSGSDTRTRDERVTLLLYFWRDRETGKIMRYESTKDVCICEETDTDLDLYPITWMSWDYVQDSYHGQASITGLRPNQMFVNRMFAMVFLSLMTTAYPKVIYDKTRLPGGWDSRVGAAIAVNGGDVTQIAKIMDPAQISPQVGEFIKIAVDYTQNFLGASDVAMGDARPDNTSAIVALQRAANTPLELTKHNMYNCVEDLCRIYIDHMRAFYGKRKVEMKGIDGADQKPFGIDFSQGEFLQEYDFAELKNLIVSVKIDVGASSYWSEMAAMQTLDNLLMNEQIGLIEYLERVPSGFIPKKQDLIATIRQAQAQAQAQSRQQSDSLAPGSIDESEMTSENMEVVPGGGNGALQRAIAAEGMSGGAA